MLSSAVGTPRLTATVSGMLDAPGAAAFPPSAGHGGSNSSSSNGMPLFKSVLPLEASISDIVHRVVKEVLQPILVPSQQPSPPSPFTFTHLDQLQQMLHQRNPNSNTGSSNSTGTSSRRAAGGVAAATAACRSGGAAAGVAAAAATAASRPDCATAESLLFPSLQPPKLIDSRSLLVLVPHDGRLLGQEALEELSMAVAAALNTVQLMTPEERTRCSTLPPDRSYETNYRQVRLVTILVLTLGFTGKLRLTCASLRSRPSMSSWQLKTEPQVPLV